MKSYTNKKISWVNNELIVSQSNKSGHGTFAVGSVRKGDLLIIQGGRILSIEEIESNTSKEMELAYHGFQVHERFYIYPITEDGNTILDGIFNVNHSCNPNAGFKDSITLVALRDIEAGEEICFDYAMTDMELPDEESWEVSRCNCGSSECRSLITGSDWKNSDLQQKYRGYFSPYLAETINRGDK